jgi:hypothetical protein
MYNFTFLKLMGFIIFYLSISLAQASQSKKNLLLNLKPPIQLIELDRTSDELTRPSWEPFWTIENYDDTIQSLKTGDKILFLDREFTLGKFLGAGQSTRIFALSKSKAIRLHLYSSVFSRAIVEGYEVFKNTGAANSVVKVFSSESKPDYNYVIVERVNALFTLEDYLNDSYKIKAPHVDPKQVYIALEKFARDMALYSEIGDYHAYQAVWDGQRFVLLDWSQGVRLAKYVYDLSPFLDDFGFQPNLNFMLYKRLEAVVTATREAYLKPQSQCINLLK